MHSIRGVMIIIIMVVVVLLLLFAADDEYAFSGIDFMTTYALICTYV